MVQKHCEPPSTPCLESIRSSVVEIISCATCQLRNVLGRLPRDQQGQTGSLMRAAWRLGEKEGMAKFRQIASWLKHDYPDAARSLLEGLEECFTINRLDVLAWLPYRGGRLHAYYIR
jgi:putative transposase